MKIVLVSTTGKTQKLSSLNTKFPHLLHQILRIKLSNLVKSEW